MRFHNQHIIWELLIYPRDAARPQAKGVAKGFATAWKWTGGRNTHILCKLLIYPRDGSQPGRGKAHSLCKLLIYPRDAYCEEDGDPEVVPVVDVSVAFWFYKLFALFQAEVVDADVLFVI